MMRRFVIFSLGLVGLLGLDRWLKSLALAGRTVDWPVGQFVLVKNEGAVFSWPLPNQVAIVIMALAILGLAWFGWRAQCRRSWSVLFGTVMMIGGAGSNLYDRLVHGFVIDWAYLGPWWPVFNLADVMIGVGLILMIFPKRKITAPSPPPR